MAFDFTDEQKSAINAPCADILVSAAAGSGKTAVLTERIIKTLTDSEHPVSITEMLVVTYTKAAASELKSRIGDALTRACAADPENRFLKAQMISVASADISTIHSFCAGLIRKYFRKLGLPAEMRIAGAAETDLLKNEVMDRVIEREYESDDGSFSEFADNFRFLKEGRLTSTLLKMYEELKSYKDGIETIKQSYASYEYVIENGFCGSVFSLPIISRVTSAGAYYAVRCREKAGRILGSDDKNIVYNANIIASDGDFFERLSKMGGESYDSIRNYITSYSFSKFNNVKSENKTALYLDADKERGDYKDKIKKYINDYFSFDPEKIRKSAKKCAAFCDKLYSVLKLFETEFSAEKLSRSMLDYNDLEKYARAILYDKDGRISEEAKETAAKYTRIYIDEYQDVSPVQDDIFRAIDRCNTFMVGDIKQSIYGFRGAAPELFSRYRDSFPDYSEGEDQKNFRIFLTKNFRCDDNVIKFSNKVFGCLFRNNSKRVAYLKQDELSFGKDPKDDQNNKVTIAIMKYGDDREKKICEARYVAEEITKLIASGTKPGDIAILSKQSVGVFDVFRDELERWGIRTHTDSKDDLLSEPSVMLIISALKIIDDPDRDIHLAALLKCPVFGFTPEELAALSFTDERSLYAALKKYSGEEGALASKCRDFESWLSSCRRYARSHSANRVIRYLYSDCLFEAIIKGSADIPSKVSYELNTFYKLAADYESGSFKGLHNFIKYIDDLSSNGIKNDNPEGEECPDSAVRLMTIHKSKGLEFKVCFVCDCGRELSLHEEKNSLILDKELGLSMTLRDDSGYLKYNTPMRRAGLLKQYENLIDEEMRVLYVALTRAKNKLYITAKSAEPEEIIRSSAELSRSRSMFGYILNKCYIKWILSSLDDEKFFELIIKHNVNPTPGIVYYGEDEEKPVKFADTDAILSAACFDYPMQRSALLPSKIAVSVLYPGVLDEDGDNMSGRMNKYPAFLIPDKKPTGAERGTATHLFMQFCDFDNVERSGIESEIENLVSERFITEESAKLIYKEKLGGFFKSDLYKSIRSSDKVYREYRFNVKMPASGFTNDPALAAALEKDELLVQGVIDCFYEDKDGNYVIVDYKTDRVYADDPEKKIEEEYRLQLGYYKYALARLTGRKVSGVYIYSFDLNKTIPVIC